MHWFYNLKISRKLATTFLIVILLECGLGGFAIARLDGVNKASTDIATNWLPSIRALCEIKISVTRLRGLDLQYILSTTEAERQDIAKHIEDEKAILAKHQKTYVGLISEPEEKALYPEVAKSIEQTHTSGKKVTDEVKQNHPKIAAKTMLDSTTSYRKLLGDIDTLIEINTKGAANSDHAAENTYRSSRLWIVGLLALSILLTIALVAWLSKVISKPLEEAVSISELVAAGDLTVVIKPEHNDETGKLLWSLKGMTDNLKRIVGEVRLGTDTINTASSEIASGNLDLSSRTEQQAGSLEETASAMEELTSTVQQNADNARQANQLAATASEVAANGGNVVNQVVETMGSINASSRKIVDIISVIDGIAFQTNILALNAAVEAARAGEQGRGFAVVASEVRSLAQRSSAAAKEIKTLIDDSVAKVDEGSKLVEQAGVTMIEVVDSVRRVTDIVGEISSASQEQSEGIGQINGAISQMDEATQQNAALVEEAAAAAQSMQEQAIRLSEVVSVFKLDQHSNFAKAATASPAKRSVDITPSAAKISNRPATKNTAAKAIKHEEKSAPAGHDDNASWEQF